VNYAKQAINSPDLKPSNNKFAIKLQMFK